MSGSNLRKLFANLSLYDTYMFEVERIFADEYVEKTASWYANYWTVTIWLGLVYIIAVFALQEYMKTRPRFDLRRSLAVWSAFLALFSFLGMIRCVPELWFTLNNHGYRMSVCVPSASFGPTAFWLFSMAVSKILELGDTVFIILRKQPLIFLHWYHHATVLIYASYIYADYGSAGRWFSSMNYTVHSVMYTYYALKACRVSVPNTVNLIITSCQITQMLIGLVCNLMIAYYKNMGYHCNMSDDNLRAATLMYLSYFILFGHFFYKRYLIEPKKSEIQPEKTTNGKKIN